MVILVLMLWFLSSLLPVVIGMVLLVLMLFFFVFVVRGCADAVVLVAVVGDRTDDVVVFGDVGDISDAGVSGTVFCCYSCRCRSLPK